MTFAEIVLVIAGTLTGLSAGVYFTFNVAIVPALRSIDAKAHIGAMQAVNLKIVNPVFMLSFLGPTLLLPLAAFLFWGSAPAWALIAAAALHIVGVNGVTIFGNIPLNNWLDNFDRTTLTDVEAEASRQQYQAAGSAWMRLHIVRTVTETAATALVFWACLATRAAI